MTKSGRLSWHSCRKGCPSADPVMPDRQSFGGEHVHIASRTGSGRMNETMAMFMGCGWFPATPKSICRTFEALVTVSDMTFPSLYLHRSTRLARRKDPDPGHKTRPCSNSRPIGGGGTSQWASHRLQKALCQVPSAHRAHDEMLFQTIACWTYLSIETFRQSFVIRANFNP